MARTQGWGGKIWAHPSPIPHSFCRDLAELGQEVSRAGRAAHAACVQLGAHLQLAEGRAGAVQEQQAQQLAQLEEHLAARGRDAERERAVLGDRWGAGGSYRVSLGAMGCCWVLWGAVGCFRLLWGATGC